MSEYCEYMWDPTRGHTSSALARSIYEEDNRFDKRDKKLAIKTVRAILREMPDVGKYTRRVRARAHSHTQKKYSKRYIFRNGFMCG